MALSNSQVQAQEAANKKAADGDKSTQLAKNQNIVEYTLFASGITHGGRNTLLEGKNLTDDVAIVFDVVDSHTFTQKITKTNYSIETKAKASDHAEVEDGTFSFSARIGDAPQGINQYNFLDKDTDPDNPVQSKRPMKSLEILLEIARSRQLVTLVTEDQILTNYIITNLEASRTVDGGAGIVYNIEMQEFRLVAIGRTVMARTSPTTDSRKAKNVQKGAKQTADGGKVDDVLKGKKSPYKGRTQSIYEDMEQWETEKLGVQFDDPIVKSDKTIRPDGKFNPDSLQR